MLGCCSGHLKQTRGLGLVQPDAESILHNLCGYGKWEGGEKL